MRNSCTKNVLHLTSDALGRLGKIVLKTYLRENRQRVEKSHCGRFGALLKLAVRSVLLQVFSTNGQVIARCHTSSRSSVKPGKIVVQ